MELKWTGDCSSLMIINLKKLLKVKIEDIPKSPNLFLTPGCFTADTAG